jgi:hypothetical protein
MSWGLAAGWLTVISLLFITFGTGAQAWANLAEFKSLRRTVSDAADEAFGEEIAESRLGRRLGPLVVFLPRLYTYPRYVLPALFRTPRKIARLRSKGGEDAVQLARFFRLAEVWGILMIGSGFGLAAASIQLALAYP